MWAAKRPVATVAPTTALAALGATVATGRFAAHMHVELVNDGPVTVSVEL